MSYAATNNASFQWPPAALVVSPTRRERRLQKGEMEKVKGKGKGFCTSDAVQYSLVLKHPKLTLFYLPTYLCTAATTTITTTPLTSVNDGAGSDTPWAHQERTICSQRGHTKPLLASGIVRYRVSRWMTVQEYCLPLWFASREIPHHLCLHQQIPYIHRTAPTVLSSDTFAKLLAS